MDKLKEWLSEKEFSFHRIETLVFLLVSAAFLLMKVIIPFIHNYTSNPAIHFIFFAIVYVMIISYWYRNRTVFPKGKSEKENIIIAIVTENAKQKSRIKVDFADNIKRQLFNLGLDTNYEVIVLHNYQSAVLQNRIDLFSQAQRASLGNSVDVLRFEKLINTLKARFIVYGNLIKRNPGNSTYYLNIKAMLFHAPTDFHNGKTLYEEFQRLWKKEISFIEKEELSGFKTNAEYVSFSASYMLGLATFIDDNYLQGIKIWEGLEEYLAEKDDLKDYYENVKRLKSSAYLMYSRYLYFNGEIEKSLQFRRKFLELFPIEYDIYLTEAINQVKVRNDPELALDFIKKAKLIAPKNEGTWRYNEFYLLLKLFRCKEALKSLDDIITNTFLNEIDIINQVISYNTVCLEEDSLHVQTHFIIGTLIYKKLNQPIYAYEKLDLFVKEASDYLEFSLIVERAKQYIIEINEIIDVKDEL